MKAVIITGGKGERLRPITYEIPKALLPVHGRPLIDHIIDLYFKYNVFEIWLSLGHKGNTIIDKYPHIPHFFERENLGTGGWLYFANAFSDKKYWKKESFFVCNGDNLFDLDLNEMLKLHKKEMAVATIACTHVKDVRAYGSVHIKNDYIVSFEEKKKSRIKKGGWINGGYYIFSPKIFEYLKKSGKKFPEPISLERDIFPLVAKDGKLVAFKSEGRWFDTGTPQRYTDVLKEWKGIA